VLILSCISSLRNVIGCHEAAAGQLSCTTKPKHADFSMQLHIFVLLTVAPSSIKYSVEDVGAPSRIGTLPQHARWRTCGGFSSGRLKAESTTRLLQAAHLLSAGRPFPLASSYFTIRRIVSWSKLALLSSRLVRWIL
jgi:hypothetical protein